MPSYMVRSQFLSCVEKMGGAEVCKIRSHAPHKLIPMPCITMKQAAKKATLGGPSRDETLPLREKTKF